MLRYFAPLALSFFLVACEAGQTPSGGLPDNHTKNTDAVSPTEDMPLNDGSEESGSTDPTRSLSGKRIPKKELPRLDELLRSNPRNLLHVQYLYCTDSHWRKSSARKNKEISMGRFVTYEEAEGKCDALASTLSQCLATQDFNISPAGLKKDYSYIKYYQNKFKDSYSTNTGPYRNRDKMHLDAQCNFVKSCEHNTGIHFDKTVAERCRAEKAN